MIRIDVDNYTILYVQYDDHLHRYAVPNQWTLGVLAGHVIDTFDKEKPPKFRRRAETKYRVYNQGGFELSPKIGVSSFVEGESLLVKVEG